MADGSPKARKEDTFAELLAHARAVRAFTRPHPRTGHVWLSCNGDQRAVKWLRRAWVEVAREFRPITLHATADGGLQLGVTFSAEGATNFGVASCGAFRMGRKGTPTLRAYPGALDGIGQSIWGCFFSQVERRASRYGVCGIQAHVGLTAMRAHYWRLKAWEAMRQLLAEIDPDALTAWRRTLSSSAALLQWLSPRTKTLAKRRRQALALFPVPLLALARDGRLPYGIREVIDQGRPLVDELAAALSIPPGSVRRLTGVTVQRIGSLANVNAYPFAALPLLPQHVRLVTRKDHASFARLVNSLVNAGIRDPDLVRALLADMRSQPGADARFERRNLFGLADMLEDGVRYVAERVIPRARMTPSWDHDDHWKEPWAALPATHAAYVRFLPAVLRGRGLTGLLRLNMLWHRFIPHAELRALGDVPAAWPGAFLDPVKVVAGRRIVELCTRNELAAEGERMAHCVGGYYRKTLMGHARILSIRDLDDSPTSTVELVLRNGRLMAIQHAAFSNELPPRADTLALRELLRAVRAGEVGIRSEWPCIRDRFEDAPPEPETAPFWDRRVDLSLALPVTPSDSCDVPKIDAPE